MWVEKYKPQSLDEVVGNLNALARARDWMKNFPGKPTKKGDLLISDRVLLLSGPEGCGKTLVANLLLHERYHIFSFSLRDIRNHKGNKELLSNFCQLYVKKKKEF